MISSAWFSAVWLLVLLLVPAKVFAQEEGVEAITTERPTAGPSPDTIPRGSLQIETGANVTFQRTSFAADLPESLFRYGVGTGFEVRLQSTNTTYTPSDGPAGKSLQMSDMALSAKALLGKPDSLLPRSAILAISAPMGSLALTSGSYDPSLTLIWSQVSHKGYFLNELVEGTLTTLAGARRPLWAPSIAGGRVLSHSLTAFVEYAPSLLPDRSLISIADGGLVFVRGRLRQLDLRGGVLNDAAGAHTILSVGYSVRQDNFLRGILGRFF